MNDKLIQVEEELVLLCIQVIEILDGLRASGKLSEEAYLAHVKEKKVFLDRRFHQDI